MDAELHKTWIQKNENAKRPSSGEVIVILKSF
jgi:hypothetical protein